MALGRLVGTAYLKIEADTAGFRSAIGGVTGTLGGMASKISSTLGALGLGRLAKEAISFGWEYRTQLDNAKAAVDGLTDSQAESAALMKDMVTLAIQTPFDLPGVQNATVRMLAFGESFGVTSTNVTDYVRIIGNAAASTGKGTDAMNNVITTMGKISGQGRVMTRDLTSLVANFPSLHPWEILSEMTGKSVKELRALSILPGGLSGVVDATDFINELVDAMENLPGASADWEGLAAATGKSVDQLKNLSDEDLMKVFRKFPDMADAMSRKMFTLGGSFEVFKDTMGVALADGLVPFFATMQDIFFDTKISDALVTLATTFGDLAGMLIESLVPVLPTLINSFQAIVVAIMPAVPAIAQLVTMFAYGMATLAPFIAALAQVASNITDLLMHLDPGLLGVIAAALIVLWLAFTGPLSGVIIAIIALVALVEIYWDQIVEFTMNMVTKVVGWWNWLYDHIFGPLADFIQSIMDFFQGLYDWLVGNSLIPDLVNKIVEWFNKLWNWLVGIVTGIVNFIKDHWQLLISIMLGPLGVILALVISHWTQIKSFISTTINAIASTLSSVWNTIKSVATSVWNTIKSTATSIWNGIKTAIIDPIVAAADKAKEMVQSILDKVRSAWSGIVSFVAGVWNGIKSAIVDPITSAWHTVEDIVGKIQSLVETVTSAVSTVSNIAHAGGGWNPLNWGAEGGIYNKPTIMGIGEAGPEALIPMNNPMRAMALMHQSGLDRLAAQMGSRQQFSGPLVSMPGAVIQDATDADLVAQRTLAAMTAAMVA